MSRSVRSLVFALVTMFALVSVAGAAPAKAKAMKAHSVVGSLEKFDPATRMLTVKTAAGSETLTLSSDAHIMSGSKMLSVNDIASEVGSRVKVSYTDANGQKTATSVRLAAAPTKTASMASADKAHKPAKK
jgi:hypothetical protein